MTFFKGVRTAIPWLLVAFVVQGAGAGILHAQETLPESDSLGSLANSDGVDSAIPSDAPTVLAQFTTGVENREPIDQVTFVENSTEKIFLFTDLRGLNGQTVQHRWIYSGETKAEVSFEVRGARWRVWSSKDLMSDWIGNWTVEIVIEGGEVIAAETFTYSAPDA
ncbi:MAG: DUF2914 domain-containing protein [Myxococcales bacterium]|nr:DUF2914 domain-containing protein [Myxococcales bacterium]HIK86442.1 DUF2914 domain-containing protein [Myxococcales bacterium]